MKILFIAHYVDLYGANRSLLALLRELKDIQGHECTVVVPRSGPLTEELEKLSIAHITLDLPWWFIKEKALTFKLDSIGKARLLLGWVKREYKALQVLKRIVAERRIDIIHTNTAVVATGYFLSRTTGIPHLWHLREYGTLDYHLRPILGLALSRKMIARSQGIIGVSHSILKHFHVTKSNGRVIYNGVGSRSFMEQHARAAQWDPTSFTFCMAGVITPSKGHEEALRALAIVVRKWPGTELRVIGDGDTSALKDLIAELGLEEHVQFYGFVKDVFPLLSKAHVLLMCSLNEAMGRVTAEAMCIGVPVIGHDSGGTAELIEHEVDGLLYSGSHEQLAEHMLRVLQDGSFYDKLATNAMQKAREAFTNEAYGRSVMELYSSVLGRDRVVLT